MTDDPDLIHEGDYRFSIIDPETGLYWDGSSAKLSFQETPVYWNDANRVLREYANYVEYCSALVKHTTPKKLKIIKEKILFKPVEEISLEPDVFAESIIYGEIRKFFRKSKSKSYSWLLGTINDRKWKKCIKEITIFAHVKQDKLTLQEVRENLPNCHCQMYYMRPVIGVVNQSDLITIRSLYPSTVFVDMTSFWDHIEQNYPGLRSSKSSSEASAETP